MRIWPTKRWWARLAIGLVTLVAFALIANGFMSWRTERRLEKKIAAIRAAGDPASIGDLAPEPIPADENAAVILEQLGPQLDAFSREYARFADSEMGKAFDARVDKGEPATPEQIAAIRAILEKYPEIPVGLAAAAKCEKYASMGDFSADHVKFLDDRLNKPTGRIRMAARFAQWQTEVLLAEGRHEEAIEQSIDLFRIARLYDEEPLLVNFLVSIAIRGVGCSMLYDALAAGPVRPELHAEVEKELSLHDTPQRLIHALKTDRAYSASVAANAGFSAAFYPKKPLYFDLVSWPMKRHFLGAMDFLDSQLAVMSKSWPNTNKQVGRAGAADSSGLGIMADLLIPALEASYNAEARIVGTMRALRIFNALSEYRTTNGREASGLADLSLPAAAMVDPFSGKPLLLKRAAEGWIVYSVMKDGVDNGGDFNGLKDYGVAPRKLRATE